MRRESGNLAGFIGFQLDGLSLYISEIHGGENVRTRIGVVNILWPKRRKPRAFKATPCLFLRVDSAIS